MEREWRNGVKGSLQGSDYRVGAWCVRLGKKGEKRMWVGYINTMLFCKETSVPGYFGIHGGSWNQFPKDTKG